MTPDAHPPPLDAERILRVLDRHGVDHVVIGGVAVIAHGNPRATFDLDLIAAPHRDNLERLGAALSDLNARAAGVDAEHLSVDPTDPEHLAAGANWTLHTDGGRLDLFGDVPGGRPYEEVRARAIRVEYGGMQVSIVGLDDLVRMKRAAGRPKDLADLAALNLTEEDEVQRGLPGAEGSDGAEPSGSPPA